MAERQRIIGQIVDETQLDNLAMELAMQYQDNLAAAGANATGELSRAAINYIFKWKGDTLQLTFRLPEEWYYVEHGRGPTTGKTGKTWQDAVGDIMRWMDVKRIVPRPRTTDKVPSRRKALSPAEQKKQMAEAIVRKIHRRGFYTATPFDVGPHGKHPLETAIIQIKLKERLIGILKDAMGKEIKVELADVVSTLHNQQTR